MERWLPIPGYDGLYEVSDMGRIRNVETDKIRRTKHTDYTKITLGRGGKHGPKKRVRVHRMVLLAFIGPQPVGYEVNHKDGDRTNNTLGNLEYVTRSQNIRHAMATIGSYQGTKHPQAKLTPAAVRIIRAENPRTLVACRILAERFGVSQYTVRSVNKGLYWNHVTAPPAKAGGLLGNRTQGMQPHACLVFAPKC